MATVELDRRAVEDGFGRQGVPLWGHAVGLALILLALLPLLGGPGQFSADEGAAMAQARLLRDDRGWALDHPLPEIDPDGEAFPLENSNPVERAQGSPAAAPFAKHPAYAVLLAFADRWAGPTGLVVTSVLGTVLAALLTAGLTRRLAPGLGAVALWTTGLATPLFVDSWIVIAHTLGAALAAAAALCVLRVHRGDGGAPLLGAGAAMVAAVLLRNEAVLLGGALAVSTLWLSWDRRRATTALAGAAVLAGALVGYEIDRWLASGITGSLEAGASGAVSHSGYLVGRLTSAFITLFLPSYGSLGLVDVLTVLAVLASVVMVVIARRRPDDRDGIRLFAVLAAGAAVGRAVLAPEVTSGLLLAAPVVAAGLAGLRGAVDGDPERRWLLGTVALFVAAILATQYASGGSGEWGGRYFAVGLPLLVPLLVMGLRRVVDGLEASTGRVVVIALAVLALAFSVAGGRALVGTEKATEELVAHVAEARETLDDPVVVATAGAAGRFAWREVLAGEDWLLVVPEELEPWLDRLAAAEREVVLATREPDRDRGALTGWRVVDDAPVGGGSSWSVLMLQEG